MMESDAPVQGAPAGTLDPLVGKVLNERFTILETLGSGGMGRVYKAVQAPLDRLVALKVLNPRYAKNKDPGFQRRFFLEASVTSKLRHPNTITVFDYGKTDDGIFYIVMEYLEGITLGRLLAESGPLPWERVLHIAQQIARSLREAHRSGIIHRDLKPANVMLLHEEQDQDHVKVLDFGLVKSFLPDAGQASQTSELTQSGVVLGSPQYMAPEQARNVADPRSDVYSLGVVLYQMLTHTPPFQAALSIDIIAKHIKEPPPPFSQVLPGHSIPAEVEALVRKCLEKSPRRRFQSMEELLEGIRTVSHTLGGGGRISGSMLAPLSPAVMEPPPALKPAAAPALGKSTVAMRRAPTRERPGAAASKRKKWKAAALYGGSVVLGLSLAAILAPRLPGRHPRVTAVQPAPVAQKPLGVAPPVPAPIESALPSDAEDTAPLEGEGSPVQFHVNSDPRGATVLHDGKVLGETPLTFELPAGEEGITRAELTFALEGYQRQTVQAEGSGLDVRFHQKLKKKVALKPKTSPRASPGYKDDPYH